MTAPTTTLRQALTQPKPTILREDARYKQTGGQGYDPWPRISSVSEWTEFNLSVLNESYGHVLDLPASRQYLQHPNAATELAGVTISNDNDVRRLIAWNDAMLEPCVAFAKAHLGIEPGVGIRHQHTKPNRFFARLPGHRTTTVDHVVSRSEYPIENLVVGLAKSSSQWSGTEVLMTRNPAANSLVTLRQLGNACVKGGVRFSYIGTDREPVACCFTHNGDEGVLDVAIRPVMWDSHGPNGLTTDLALWWLCMLAMSGSTNRTLVARPHMTRIDEWAYSVDPGTQGVFRRHGYSGFVEAMVPLLATDQQPSPAADATNAQAGESLDLVNWGELGLPNAAGAGLEGDSAPPAE